MTRKDISDGVGNISTRHIQEAASYMAAEKGQLFQEAFWQINDRGCSRAVHTRWRH